MAMQELFDVIKGLTGFAGNIMMQYAGQEAYVEKGGVQAILEHLHGGKQVGTASIRMEMADGFEEQIQGAHVPYTAFDVKAEDDRELRLYAFRDKDMAVVKDIIRDMTIDLPEIFMEPEVPLWEKAMNEELEPGL